MSSILVVEDNPLNMELATDLLETAGHVVRQARTAEEGIRLASIEQPDMILMDIRLPGMDGIAAIRALKTDARTNHIPTIALTAQAMKGDRDVAMAAGFDGYISKPIDTRTFAQQINDLLGQRSRG